MDQESARIGGQVVGSGYRMEMNNMVVMILVGLCTEEEVLEFNELQVSFEGMWRCYVQHHRGDVSRFNRLQSKQNKLWQEFIASKFDGDDPPGD